MQNSEHLQGQKNRHKSKIEYRQLAGKQSINTMCKADNIVTIS